MGDARSKELIPIIEGFLGPPRSYVLDLGCGGGAIAVPLARKGYRVVGIEREREFLNELARHQDTESLEVIRGSILSPPICINNVQACLLVGVLPYLDMTQFDRVLHSLETSLGRDGLVIVSHEEAITVLAQNPSPRLRGIPDLGVTVVILSVDEKTGQLTLEANDPRTGERIHTKVRLWPEWVLRFMMNLHGFILKDSAEADEEVLDCFTKAPESPHM